MEVRVIPDFPHEINSFMPNLGSYLQNNESSINLRDYRHASRLYIDGGYDLMPKSSWLYYVTFEINSNALKDLIFGGRKKSQEVGTLVKSVELPKYQVNTETMNQYNRKTVIQKNITYQPVSFTLHDDHSNRVNDMWINYFRYYYRDTRLTTDSPLDNLVNSTARGILGANVGGFVSKLIGTSSDPANGPYGNTKYKNQDDRFILTDYGLNSQNVDKPFFNSITIYQINRQKFYSYQLINPMIKNWEHDKLDQTSSNKTAESKMTVDYETVFYSKGTVSKDNPSGFATLNYDTMPSPLGVGTKGFKSVFKNALSGAADIFGDILGDSGPSQGSMLLNAINAVSTVGGLGGIVASNTLAPRNSGSTGYSTLDSRGFPPQTSVNSLGINLNLNLGNNPKTANTPIASPIILAPNISNLAITGISENKSSESPDISANLTQSLNRIEQQINEASQSVGGQDNTPQGTTPALGTYFTMPVPLTDTLPYLATNITNQSSITEIQQEIKKINSAWANDNEFVAQQILDPETINAKLSTAVTDVDFNVIKNDATAVIAAIKSLQETVNGKYQSEYQRLTTLLDGKINNVFSSSNVT